MMDSDALDAPILRAGSQSCTCSGTSSGQPCNCRSDLSDSDTTGMIRVQARVMMMKRLGASATEFLYGAVYWLEDMSRMQEGMTGDGRPLLSHSS